MTIEATDTAAPTPRPASAWRNILEIAAIIVGVLIGMIAGGLTGFLPAGPILGMLVPILFATFFLKRRGQSWGGLGLARPERLGPIFGWAIAAILGGALAGMLANKLATAAGAPSPDISLLVDFIDGNFIHYLWFLIPISWLSAGIGEEMIARGFLLDRFAALFHRSSHAAALGVVGQAALFGLGHFYQGWTGMLSVTSLALVFGFVYLKAGRTLWPTIIAHASIDSFAITMLYTGNADLLNF